MIYLTYVLFGPDLGHLFFFFFFLPDPRSNCLVWNWKVWKIRPDKAGSEALN